MGDATDANLFSYFVSTRNVESVISSKTQICERLADFYDVRHENRGVALIFNHSVFNDKSLNVREGTEKDRDYLIRVLTDLEFDVRVYDDLIYSDMYNVLEKVSEENHTHSDCLLICVMSHGENGKIHARDHMYPADILWMPFTGDRCPTLAGKPKMFFLQACRGNEVDNGTFIRNVIETDSGKNDPIVYSIPALADILVMYSSYQGYYSWRSPHNGSWFIQALCQELQSKSNYCDLLTILTFVNRRVAVLHESNVPGDKKMHKKKQICPIVSMLTRLMIFPPKRNAATNTDSNETSPPQQLASATESN